MGAVAVMNRAADLSRLLHQSSSRASCVAKPPSRILMPGWFEMVRHKIMRW